MGILAGAGVMLTLFPWIHSKIRKRMEEPDRRRIEQMLRNPGVTRVGLVLTVTIHAIALGIVCFRGFPQVDHTTTSLRPRNSEAYFALDRLQSTFGEARHQLNYIVSGTSATDTASKLSRFTQALQIAENDGRIESFHSANNLWPNPEFQKVNLSHLRELKAMLPMFVVAGESAGFESGAFALLERISATIEDWSDDPLPILPSTGDTGWILRRIISVTPESSAALVSVRTSSSENEVALLAENLALPVSWQALSATLSSRLPREMANISILVAIGISVMLIIALRSLKATAIVVTALVSSFLALLGVMTLFGMSWNLFNIAAVLLLAGTSVDYGIHIMHAARHGDDVDAVRGVIVLCGISTAAGFASCAMASNLGLASLGLTCAIGITLNTLVAVFVLGPVARLVSPLLDAPDPIQRPDRAEREE
jgi:predicted exporter